MNATIAFTYREDRPWGHTPREVVDLLAELASQYGLLDVDIVITEHAA